jgi:hypothetical protein
VCPGRESPHLIDPALEFGSSQSVYSALPDLPTIAEAGVPGYEVTAWFGLAVPAHTERAIIDRLNRVAGERWGEVISVDSRRTTGCNAVVLQSMRLLAARNGDGR